MQTRSITMPDGLSAKAKSLGINVSRTAVIAVEESVKKLEKPNDGGTPVAKLEAPNNRSQRRAQ